MHSFANQAVGGLIWLGLMHSLWIGLLAAAGVALIFQAGFRLSHRSRHAILGAAIVAVALGPVVVTAFHRLIEFLPPGGSSTSVESQFVVITGKSSADTGPAREASDQQQPANHSTPTRRLSPILVLSTAVEFVRRIRTIGLAVWLLCVTVLSAILVLGARGVRRICRGAEPAGYSIQEKTRRLARRLRLRRIPRVLIHPEVAEPFLYGTIRPVIVLPASWLESATPDLIDAILAHELAHARRLDLLVNLLQRLAEIGLFFHPAVHWLSRSLRRERELCTDALAIRLTGDPLALAQALESVARLRLMSRSPARMPIAGMSLGGQTASLLPRIQELIGMTPIRPRPQVWPFAALPLAAILALFVTATGLARDEPPSEPSVQVGAVRFATEADTKVAQLAAPKPGSPEDKDRPTVVFDTRIVTRPFPHGDPEITATPSMNQTDNQISYQVGFISLDANPWREHLKDRLHLIKQEADVSAWILNNDALEAFLKVAPRDVTTGYISAPKVTAFENSHATYIHRGKQFYVAGVETVAVAKPVGFRPTVKDIEVGWKADIKGSFLPRGTRLTVDVSDSSLSSIHTLSRKEEFDGRAFIASYQVPTAVKRRCEVSCDLNDGSSLVISLGLSDRSVPLTGAAKLASILLELAGHPRLEAEPVTCERLVVITPRKIVLESEEQRIPASVPPVLQPKKS